MAKKKTKRLIKLGVRDLRRVGACGSSRRQWKELFGPDPVRLTEHRLMRFANRRYFPDHCGRRICAIDLRRFGSLLLGLGAGHPWYVRTSPVLYRDDGYPRLITKRDVERLIVSFLDELNKDGAQ